MGKTDGRKRVNRIIKRVVEKLKQIYGKSFDKFQPWIDENGCVYEEIVKPNMIGLKEKDIERPYLNSSWWRPLELNKIRIGDNFKD